MPDLFIFYGGLAIYDIIYVTIIWNNIIWSGIINLDEFNCGIYSVKGDYYYCAHKNARLTHKSEPDLY